MSQEHVYIPDDQRDTGPEETVLSQLAYQLGTGADLHSK
jgi:hypothetical protein